MTVPRPPQYEIRALSREANDAISAIQQGAAVALDRVRTAALAASGLDPADGWAVDIAGRCFSRLKATSAEVEGLPPDVPDAP